MYCQGCSQKFSRLRYSQFSKFTIFGFPLPSRFHADDLMLIIFAFYSGNCTIFQQSLIYPLLICFVFAFYSSLTYALAYWHAGTCTVAIYNLCLLLQVLQDLYISVRKLMVFPQPIRLCICVRILSQTHNLIGYPTQRDEIEIVVEVHFKRGFGSSSVQYPDDLIFPVNNRKISVFGLVCWVTRISQVRDQGTEWQCQHQSVPTMLLFTDRFETSVFSLGTPLGI